MRTQSTLQASKLATVTQYVQLSGAIENAIAGIREAVKAAFLSAAVASTKANRALIMANLTHAGEAAAYTNKKHAQHTLVYARIYRR